MWEKVIAEEPGKTPARDVNNVSPADSVHGFFTSQPVGNRAGWWGSLVDNRDECFTPIHKLIIYSTNYHLFIIQGTTLKF